MLLVLTQTGILLHTLEHVGQQDADHLDVHCALCVTVHHLNAIPVQAFLLQHPPALTAPAIHPDVLQPTATVLMPWQARAPPL